MADRKISDLTALTTPASGDYVPIVDISEAAAASKNKRVTIQSLFQGIPVNVGIGTTTVGSLLHLAASAGAALRLEALTANLALDSVVGEIEFEANDASAQGTGIKAKLGAYSDVAAGNSVGLRFFAGATSENTGTERYRIAADGGHIFNGVGGSSTERARIDSSGRVGIGTTTPTTLLDVNADTVRVRTARTPASATATGATGEICWDANYIYVCTATNTWRRTAISSW